MACARFNGKIYSTILLVNPAHQASHLGCITNFARSQLKRVEIQL